MKLEDLLTRHVQPLFTQMDIEVPTSQEILQPLFRQSDTEVQSVQEIPDYILNDPQLVGYPDAEMQDQIYKLVTDALFQFTNSEEPCEFFVKDYGAGRGDISTWLVGNNIRYIGLETNPILVEAGLKKYGNNSGLLQKDFFESNFKSDFTICVGTLNSIPTKDKWKLFRDTMQKALETTCEKIIFVLANKFDVEGYNDFPFTELHANMPNNPFTIDYTFLEDIYMLTVHVDEFKQ